MTIAAALRTDVLEDADYDTFSAKLRTSFAGKVGAGTPLFTVGVEGLFETYLRHLPLGMQQVHTCSACRRFIETYGGLVLIDENGATQSAMWSFDDAPPAYAAAVQALRGAVERAPVTGVFLSSEPEWGTPRTGPWHHLAVTPTKGMLFQRSILTAGQSMAEKREDYRILCDALRDFTPAILEQAVTLLKSETMYRSEKVLGVAEWLLAVHRARTHAISSAHRTAGTWLAVATAPTGFCHVRSTMIGTLLEDLAAGLPVADIAAKFKAKMHPLQYQRPQAAPAAGNIAQAEKVVAQLGIAASLKRRFARLEDVAVACWRPVVRAQQPVDGGVFAHLQPKGASPTTLDLPSVTMTWEKFARTVLPEAESIELLAPSHGSYGALVTAVDPNAPPLLQWDREDQRNPVSWYVYHGGSLASAWNVTPGYVKVTAVTLQPSMWHRALDHQGAAVFFLLDGARDLRGGGSLALFPECLRSELHGIRSTIEAFSRAGRLEGRDEASACGLKLEKGQAWNVTVRVTNKAGRAVFKLDRWD